MSKHSHYHKDVTHLKTIDVYRTLELFGVTDQALGHAIKKLLCAGQRGAGKTFEQDVREAVDTLNRRLQMLAEDDVPRMAAGGPERLPDETVLEYRQRIEAVIPWQTWHGKGPMPVPAGIKIDVQDHDGEMHIGVVSGDFTNEPRHWTYSTPDISSIVAWRPSIK